MFFVKLKLPKFVDEKPRKDFSSEQCSIPLTLSNLCFLYEKQIVGPLVTMLCDVTGCFLVMFYSARLMESINVICTHVLFFINVTKHNVIDYQLYQCSIQSYFKQFMYMY